jgi:hypothetical protein
MTAPTIGLAEAARISGVSESTIRRKRTELLELGASHGPKGWSIPIPALVQLGLLDATTAPDPVTAPVPMPDSPLEASTTPPEVEALRDALTAAELRAAVAEAVLAERDRLLAERERVIETQAQALRMLEPPRVTAPDEQQVKPSAVSELAPEPRPTKRRWWHL